MKKEEYIEVITEVKSKDARACEICGGLTDSIDMHICGYCRHALALMIHDWEVRK